MKGQFMLLSAVIISLVTLSVAEVITETQNQGYTVPETGSEAVYIQQEADEVVDGYPTRLERENYRKLVGYTDYASEVDYDQDSNCFNVTLVRPQARITFECLPQN